MCRIHVDISMYIHMCMCMNIYLYIYICMYRSCLHLLEVVMIAKVAVAPAHAFSPRQSSKMHWVLDVVEARQQEPEDAGQCHAAVSSSPTDCQQKDGGLWAVKQPLNHRLELHAEHAKQRRMHHVVDDVCALAWMHFRQVALVRVAEGNGVEEEIWLAMLMSTLARPCVSKEVVEAWVFNIGPQAVAGADLDSLHDELRGRNSAAMWRRIDVHR